MEPHLQLLGAAAVFVGHLLGDTAFLHEVVHVTVEAYHAIIAGDLNTGGQLVEFAVENFLLHKRRADHDFLRGHHAAIERGAHALGDGTHDDFTVFFALHLPFFFWEEVEQTAGD